jgi:hypothetical protein
LLLIELKLGFWKLGSIRRIRKKGKQLLGRVGAFVFFAKALAAIWPKIEPRYNQKFAPLITGDSVAAGGDWHYRR